MRDENDPLDSNDQNYNADDGNGAANDSYRRAEMDDYFQACLDTLRKEAQRLFQHERANHTLDATGLVHDAYIKLTSSNSTLNFQSKEHFLATAGIAMRHLLCDYARKHKSLKKGGGNIRELPTTCTICVRPDETKIVNLWSLDEALTELEQKDSEQYEIVVLRSMSGLTVPQAAHVMGISERKALRLWRPANAWLNVQLNR